MDEGKLLAAYKELHNGMLHCYEALGEHQEAKAFMEFMTDLEMKPKMGLSDKIHLVLLFPMARLGSFIMSKATLTDRELNLVREGLGLGRKKK